MADASARPLRHIAIIMDGNRRYAEESGLPKMEGHRRGADNIENICDAMIEFGIPYLTVYAFSTENWKRSRQEVTYLMDLMKYYLTIRESTALKKGIRIRVIGDRSGLDDELVGLIEKDEDDTKRLVKLTLTFAINYGGRDEITRAARSIATDCVEGKMAPSDITEQVISSRLDTKDIPDPDLLIRTSGEMRLSNYLLWQMAYTEFYFTDKYWPAFTKEDLALAIQAYEKRDRRFGGREETQ